MGFCIMKLVLYGVHGGYECHTYNHYIVILGGVYFRV